MIPRRRRKSARLEPKKAEIDDHLARDSATLKEQASLYRALRCPMLPGGRAKYCASALRKLWLAEKAGTRPAETRTTNKALLYSTQFGAPRVIIRSTMLSTTNCPNLCSVILNDATPKSLSENETCCAAVNFAQGALVDWIPPKRKSSAIALQTPDADTEIKVR